jgi:anti-sigma-K factor RskA
MSCPGLTPEDYQLFTLGLCELSEAERIRTHVAEGCGVCSAELRQSVVFWYQFALLGAEDSEAQPRPELRTKILESATTTQIRQPRTIRWSRQQAVAAAVALVAVSALSWYFGNQGFLRRSQPVSVAVTRPAPAAQPQEDVRALKERLERAEQALAARGRAEAPAKRAPVTTPEGAVLESALAEARRALGDARQALTEQQTRTAALENDLRTQRNLLATAVRERQESENRAASLTADRIQALTSRIQQLERENAEYRTVIDRQRINIEQNLRLASLLNSPSLRMVKLQSTEKGAAAVGYAFVEGSRVLFYASGLPNLPAGKIYQLWLIRGRSPAIVSGGVFAAGNQQRAIVEFSNPQLVSNITALAVTDEPAGGSSLPTGHKFLIGSMRSS